MASRIEAVGGQPGGVVIRSFLSVAFNADGTLNSVGSGIAAAVLGADFSAVPTSDPHVAGRLWASTGTLKVSAG